MSVWPPLPYIQPSDVSEESGIMSSNKPAVERLQALSAMTSTRFGQGHCIHLNYPFAEIYWSNSVVNPLAALLERAFAML